MLNYQSTSFHDALYVREALGLRQTPEFEQWWIEASLGDQFRRPLRVEPAGSAFGELVTEIVR
jgi:ethanolamine ammonia-lyase large subunit